jgi:NAD(P)H-nitrite reductase large subunit
MSQCVCYCFRVEKKRLIEAIEAGNHTIESLGKATGAGHGCGGCRWDLESLIAFYSQPPSETQNHNLH